RRSAKPELPPPRADRARSPDRSVPPPPPRRPAPAIHAPRRPPRAAPARARPRHAEAACRRCRTGAVKASALEVEVRAEPAREGGDQARRAVHVVELDHLDG